MTSAGLEDVYVVKRDPQGNLVWSARAGGAGSHWPLGVAADPLSHVVLATMGSDTQIEFTVTKFAP